MKSVGAISISDFDFLRSLWWWWWSGRRGEKEDDEGRVEIKLLLFSCFGDPSGFLLLPEMLKDVLWCRVSLW